jgi:hypothetical protein
MPCKIPGHYGIDNTIKRLDRMVDDGYNRWLKHVGMQNLGFVQ